MTAPFHLSFPVADLSHARGFYSDVLGCREGESTSAYVNFAFFGSQITCHLSPDRVRPAAQFGLDGNHFGAIITTDEFVRLEERLRSAGVVFLKAPETQNAGTARERRKMIFADPSGNAIEMKCYVDQASIFA